MIVRQIRSSSGFPPCLVEGLAALKRLEKTQLNAASYEGDRFSFSNCGSSHQQAVKSEKHKQHLEVTYSRDLINARRALKVMMFFTFTVCNSIFCSVGTSGETEAETASDQQKDNEKSQSHSSSKSCVWKGFPKKRGKQNRHQAT